MVLLKTCWNPCFLTDSFTYGVYAIAIYTGGLSIVFILVIDHMFEGGESYEIWSPLFNTDIRDSMQWWGGFYEAYLLVMILASICIYFAMETQLRGWLLPWLIWMGSFILCQFVCGFWWLYDFDTQLASFTVTFANWSWMGYHVSKC